MQGIETKVKAHIRSKIPRLMKLSFGCEVINEVGQPAKVLFATPSWKKGGMDVRLDDTAIKIHESELKEIIGHPPQLQHYLTVLEDLWGDIDNICVRPEHLSVCVNFDEDHWIDFSTVTGQPATEEDWEALANILGL